MLISDPNLANSNYTSILNEKYPQRKYLRHNLTSWLRCNKSKIRDISVKITNPELKYKHDSLNFKKLSYNNEEVNELDINKLEDAMEIIKKLKVKVLEYEETNNTNIESSMKIIDDLKSENEFFKKKLLENYEVLDKYEEKFGDTAVIGDYKNSTLMKFQRKYSAIKLFSILKNNMKRIRAYREKYVKFYENVNFVLKIKAFLSLQKNALIEKYSSKLQLKKYFQMYKSAFKSLKDNLMLCRLSQNFFQIQKTIILVFYFKTLRLNIGQKRINSIYRNKGSGHYYSKKLRNVFEILKYNVYYNKEKGLSRPRKIDEREQSKNSQKRISFLNFLKDTNTLEIQPVLKEHKFRALKVLRQVYEVI